MEIHFFFYINGIVAFEFTIKTQLIDMESNYQYIIELTLILNVFDECVIIMKL